MKKRGWVFPAVTTVLILIVILPLLIGSVRRHELNTQKPVPVAGIGRLIEEQGGTVGVVGEEPISSKNAALVEGQPPVQEPTFSVPGPPDHLASTATREMAASYFPMREEPEGVWLESTAARAFESVFWSVGLNDAAYPVTVQLGENYFFSGEWAAARSYFESTLRMPGGAAEKRVAAARLAWLESDPQRAAYLLELSCVENDPGPLTDAAALCRMTGSDALAAHYEARLREAEAETEQ